MNQKRFEIHNNTQFNPKNHQIQNYNNLLIKSPQISKTSFNRNNHKNKTSQIHTNPQRLSTKKSHQVNHRRVLPSKESSEAATERLRRFLEKRSRFSSESLEIPVKLCPWRFCDKTEPFRPPAIDSLQLRFMSVRIGSFRSGKRHREGKWWLEMEEISLRSS